MNANGLLDPAYAGFVDEPASEWTLDSLPGIRARIHGGYPSTRTAHAKQRWTPASIHGPAVRVCIYRPDSDEVDDRTLPAIFYIHGGGFVLGRPEMADAYLDNLAKALRAVVVAVDYRLAPEHPFPAPLDDCHTALEWLVAEAPALGIDRHRVVIMGHSAGGGLAAALALRVRDQGQYRSAGLMMLYPMLDHRTGTPAAAVDNPTTGTLSWTRDANRFCWQCLRGAYAIEDERAYLFSPALAPHLQGLPPSFIGVGALDLFLEEDAAFALGLSRAGVPIEMHIYPGAPHMFDQYPGATTDQCQRDTACALQNMLAPRTTRMPGP